MTEASLDNPNNLTSQNYRSAKFPQNLLEKVFTPDSISGVKIGATLSTLMYAEATVRLGTGFGKIPFSPDSRINTFWLIYLGLGYSLTGAAAGYIVGRTPFTANLLKDKYYFMKAYYTEYLAKGRI